MRILLLADIHANWPALQAIQEPFDVCLVLGDLVDYGLEPAPCIDWVRQKASHAVRGNHDHSAAHNVPVTGKVGYRYLTAVTRPITQEKLQGEDRRYLASLPVTCTLTLNQVRYLLVHATPRDPLDEYAVADADFWARRLHNVDAQVICVAHTHFPYVLEIGDKLVINPGSVGQPRDGDPRAAYAIIDNQRVELKRIDYPVDQTIRTVLESSLPEPAKGLLTEVFRTGSLAKPDSDKQKGQLETPPDNGRTVIYEAPPVETTQVFEDPDAAALSPAARAKFPPGATLGDYRLLQKLGAGGMGDVYKAQQISQQRLVAVKVLDKHLAAKPTFLQRFLRESQLMARLDHPNILRCFEAKEVHGTHYIAMEYVDGGTVEEWLKKRGKFTIGDALFLILSSARGLQHAHAQRLIHRDMKPDNLLLTRAGAVKVADLGLAKTLGEDFSLTRTGTVAGTPNYLAPEQARDAKRVDGRTDIYALGGMLYRFLTGEFPFKGNNVVDLIQAKEKGTFPSARRINPEVPDALERILNKMLAKNPDQRYQSCGELLADLEGLGLASQRLSFLRGEEIEILVPQ